MPAVVPKWLQAVPFLGDAASFVNTYIESRNAGLDPKTSVIRAGAKAGTGLGASFVPGGDVVTSAPVVLKELRDMQKRRVAAARDAKDKYAEAAVISHPNPLIQGSILPRPESPLGEAFQDVLNFISPENQALQVVDFYNPDISGLSSSTAKSATVT